MVVAPKSTLGNWMKEIKRFCPLLRAVKFLGNPEERVSLLTNLYVAFQAYVYIFYLKIIGLLEIHTRGITCCWQV